MKFITIQHGYLNFNTVKQKYCKSKLWKFNLHEIDSLINIMAHISTVDDVFDMACLLNQNQKINLTMLLTNEKVINSIGLYIINLVNINQETKRKVRSNVKVEFIKSI